MFNKILLSLLLILPVTGYSQNKQPFVIDPRKFGDEKITLSEIADDISYIPLDNALPLGNIEITKYFLTDNNLFGYDVSTGVLKFDRSGKLLNKIGALGRGPGEYDYIQSYTVDERTGNVFLFEPSLSKLKTYTSSGRFIRDIKLDKEIFRTGINIEIFNSRIFVAEYLGDSKNAWIILDTLGNILTKRVNSIQFIAKGGIYGDVYMFNKNLYYTNRYNDTIFRISETFNSSPAYLFAKGDFRIPASEGPISSMELFTPIKITETNKYLFLSYSFKRKMAIAVLDKISSRVYNVPSLINDIDGGLSPNYYHYYNDEKSNTEYLYRLIQTSQIKQQLSSDQFKKSKSSAHKNEFESMATKLDEMDNPVLMIVRLKK